MAFERNRVYDAVEVAWKMLKTANEKGITLSNLQVQKLVYIAHGYLLGWRNRPLINSPIAAWKYGPVIDDVYHTFKEYKSDKIPNKGLAVVATDIDDDDDAMEVISSVLDLYGRQSAMELVNLTHQFNTPWDEVWNKKGGKDLHSAEIPNVLIKNHFRKVIADPESVNGL